MRGGRVDVDRLAAEVVGGSRTALARAVTLVESRRDDHRRAARELLDRLVPESGGAVRVGISGVPGVGKSTFIETLGLRLLDGGHRVGVLAVDPSSRRTGGSVLGDKTRMGELATRPASYIRPSPTAGTLGGVASATLQAMTVLEAGGFDVVLVETVGVGQSEIAVAGMVDTFLYLTMARTGDALQGIKKGIVEIADVVAVNKADSGSEGDARVAARELSGVLRLVHHGRGTWVPPVRVCSALADVGIDEVWSQVEAHRAHLGEEGLADKRARQQLEFAWSLVRDELDRRLRADERVAEVRNAVRAEILAGRMPAPTGADLVLEAYDNAPPRRRDV